MGRMEKIEKLVSREKRVFRFLVLYLLLSILLMLLFVNSKGWLFIEVAILVLILEIGITGLLKRGKPLHTNEDVCKELSNIKEIDEYVSLREEYSRKRKKLMCELFAIYAVLIGSIWFFKKFDVAYVALFVAGFLALYFSTYLLFRYKIDRITIILLQRKKVIREMKKEEMKKKRRLRFKKLSIRKKKSS